MLLLREHFVFDGIPFDEKCLRSDLRFTTSVCRFWFCHKSEHFETLLRSLLKLVRSQILFLKRKTREARDNDIKWMNSWFDLLLDKLLKFSKHTRNPSVWFQYCFNPREISWITRLKVLTNWSGHRAWSQRDDPSLLSKLVHCRPLALSTQTLR